MFTQIHRNEAKDIRMILEENLRGILESNGLKLDSGNCVYDGDSVTFTKFRVSLTGALSQGEKELERYNDFCRKVGWATLATNVVATLSGGQKVTLVEHHPRKRKFPFIVEECGTGKHYKITKDAAEKMFGVRHTPVEG